MASKCSRSAESAELTEFSAVPFAAPRTESAERRRGANTRNASTMATHTSPSDVSNSATRHGCLDHCAYAGKPVRTNPASTPPAVITTPALVSATFTQSPAIVSVFHPSSVLVTPEVCRAPTHAAKPLPAPHPEIALDEGN